MGTLCWRLLDFEGQEISSGQSGAEVPGTGARRILTLRYQDILQGRRRDSAALCLKLRSGDGTPADEKTYLLVPDKNARLPRPAIQVHCTIVHGQAEIRLSTDVYARYVYVEIEGIDAPLSDNYFDIPGQGSYTVTVNVPEGTAAADLEKRLCIQTLAGVEPKNSRLADRFRRFGMRFHWINLLTWFLFKFLA